MMSYIVDESQFSKKQNFASIGVHAVDEPDTIENLIQQLYNMTQDHRDATINLRYNLLGSFPSSVQEVDKNPSPEGLINQMKSVLKMSIRNMHEAREHISYVSKDVR